MQMSTAVTYSRLGHRPPVWRTHQDIAHPCGEYTRTSPTRAENTPGHRPPMWRTHQDIAHSCGEHTRTSPTRVENTPGDTAHPCGEHTRASPTLVENTPGHRPPVWRTHQDIAHPCGEHTGDIAHPCGEHTRRVSTSHPRPSVSVSAMVSVPDSCFCLTVLFGKVI